jgi:hypothetical protein
VQYKPGKINIIPDALSRLEICDSSPTAEIDTDSALQPSISDPVSSIDSALYSIDPVLHSITDPVPSIDPQIEFAFPISILQTSVQFLDKLQTGYTSDPRY